MGERFETQCEAILDALQKGEMITPLSALANFRCLRLAARIRDLRRRGVKITTLNLHDRGKRYAGYKMEAVGQLNLFDSGDDR